EPRFALSSSRTSAAMRAGDWFLALHLAAHAPPGGTRRYDEHQVELFDLGSDPRCERDLVEREPERARRMRAALIDWLAAARPLDWAEEGRADAEILAGLARLGYAGEAEGGAGPAEIDADCG